MLFASVMSSACRLSIVNTVALVSLLICMLRFLFYNSLSRSDSDPPIQFSMEKTSYQASALERQITEAIKINNTPVELRLNSREEWGHTRLVRALLANL